MSIIVIGQFGLRQIITMVNGAAAARVKSDNSLTFHSSYRVAETNSESLIFVALDIRH
jgi:hypothetical protein